MSIFIRAVIFCLLLTNSIVFGQSLANTTWLVQQKNAPGTPTYFHFGKDTLKWSSNPSPASFTAISTYTASGNTFSVSDIGTGICGPTVGIYSYVIDVDTLKSTPINDPCFSRRDMIALNYRWTNTNKTGLDELNATTLSVYPNPTSTFLYLPPNHSGARLLNAEGRLVKRAGPEESTLYLADLPAGIYMLVLARPGASPVTRRVVVEH